jgi:hypothetical protein
MRCRSVAEDLTAWIEGGLPRRRDDRIRRHVAACADCAAQAESLRTAVAWQRRALQAVSAATDVDPAPLCAHLRRVLVAQAAEGRWGWRFLPPVSSLWGRVALAGAALSAAAVVLFLAGDSGMVLIPLGLESPPPAVTRQTELFKEYPLIEQLDVLEHFDTVESVPLDDEGAAHRG